MTKRITWLPGRGFSCDELGLPQDLEPSRYARHVLLAPVSLAAVHILLGWAMTNFLVRDGDGHRVHSFETKTDTKPAAWVCSACDVIFTGRLMESEAAKAFREYHQKVYGENAEDEPPKMGDGRPLDVQLWGVWDVLREHTNGEHSNVCKGPAYECVEAVLNDREYTISQLTEQRDIEGAANLRLIEENRQMRALIHTLTGDPSLTPEQLARARDIPGIESSI